MSEQLKTLERYHAWKREGCVGAVDLIGIDAAIEYAAAVVKAAENLVAVKGRHHTEQAYNGLVATVSANKIQHTKEKE